MKLLFIFLLLHFFAFSQEKIIFKSANPFSFKDIINNLDNIEEEEIFGILTFPNVHTNSEKVFPVIIAVAGSYGWSEHHYEYLEMYRDLGIATFELKSFESRGITSTVGTQVEVTTAMMILDSYRALEKLTLDKRIDKNKIAITGWSLGGGVALYSAWLPLKLAINDSLNFAAHLCFYPPCIVEPEILTFSNYPIHILIGELDNWTPAGACLKLCEKIKKNGGEIDITIYEGSYHSFDRQHSLKINKKAYILSNCQFKMKKNGTVVMNFLNIPMSTPTLQKIGLFFCAKRGPIYGCNEKAREESFNFSKEFMYKHLLNP